LRIRSITLRAVAAAAVVLLALPASALAQPGSSSSVTAGARPNPPAAPASKTTCAAATSSTPERCIQVQRSLVSALSPSQRAERASVLKAHAAKAKTNQANAAAAALPSPPAACTANWTIAAPDRFDSCSDVVWTITQTKTTNGVTTTVGTFQFEDQQWTTYSATSQSWKHGMNTIGYPPVPGTLVDGVTGAMFSECSQAASICTASSLGIPDPQPFAIAPDSDQVFGWTEFDDGPSSTTASSVNTLDGFLGVTWEISTNGLITDAVDTTVLTGRCDTIATTTDGCVNEDFIPTMYPSYAVDGASADMINFYEENVAPYYGNQYSPDPQPLHRLTDPVLSGANGNNREVICGDGSFTADSAITAALAPYNDKDSCDEYPFASTYESGAMVDGSDGNPKPHVTTGADCVQVTANHTDTTNEFEPTDWSTASLTVNFISGATNPCIRGHIPLLLNSHVGSEYSALIRTSRLIDKDAFWVEVTP
jgi:hypothetical protein